jgi:hypothetical protein
MRYLRAFSYLLGLCGVIGCVAGIAIVYQAFADGGAAEVSLPLGSAVFGIAAIAAEGVTIAAGVLGVAASCNQRRAGALYTTALAGLVATVLGLGLCYATGAGVPTSLVFNGLLMVICAVVTPDASPVTMLLMFAAMIVLYEGSLFIARLVLGRRIKAQNERLAAEEDE